MIPRFLLSFALLATPSLASDALTAGTECEHVISKEITGLLSSDRQNILGKQYYLTILKAAQVARGSRVIEAKIHELSNQISSSPEVIAKLKQLYESQGRTANFESLKQRFEQASYFHPDQRLTNQELSAFFLGDTLIDGKSPFDETDVAITWFMGEIADATSKRFGEHTAVSNLTTASVQIARINGVVAGESRMSTTELSQKIKQTELEVEKLMEALRVRAVKLVPPECRSLISCEKKFESAFSSTLSALARDKQKMDAASVTKDLKSNSKSPFPFFIYSYFRPDAKTTLSVKPTSSGTEVTAQVEASKTEKKTFTYREPKAPAKVTLKTAKDMQKIMDDTHFWSGEKTYAFDCLGPKGIRRTPLSVHFKTYSTFNRIASIDSTTQRVSIHGKEYNFFGNKVTERIVSCINTYLDAEECNGQSKPSRTVASCKDDSVKIKELNDEHVEQINEMAENMLDALEEGKKD